MFGSFLILVGAFAFIFGCKVISGSIQSSDIFFGIVNCILGSMFILIGKSDIDEKMGRK